MKKDLFSNKIKLDDKEYPTLIEAILNHKECNNNVLERIKDLECFNDFSYEVKEKIKSMMNKFTSNSLKNALSDIKDESIGYALN